MAKPSLLSLSQNVMMAENSGRSVEAILVLDRPDDGTLELFSEFAAEHSWARLLAVDFGDLGLARNAGVDASAGEWIAFLDADDLWGANWLVSALKTARMDTRMVVWHPELNVYFGHDPHVYQHIDMEDPDFTLSSLALSNCWTALCFAKRDMLIRIPYRMTEISKQIGYEDWSWHLETISHGVIHKIVPGTGHVIRRKRASLVAETNSARCMPRPSDLFCNDIDQRYLGV